MRKLQTLSTLSGVAQASTQSIPLTALDTRVGDLPANLAALHIRIAKVGASAVRPWAGGARVEVRDDNEVLFDAAAGELLAQAREDGRAMSAQLAAGNAADAVLLTWRPGYGKKDGDRMHAAGLFHGGGVRVTLPTDGANTFNVTVVAELAGAPELVLAARAVTRELGASDRQVAGDFIAARLRDLSHAAGNSYLVETSRRQLVAGVAGAVLTDLYEQSAGNLSDPVTTGAGAASTVRAPDIMRATLGAHESGPVPLSKLPHSAGNLRLTSGFAGVPVVQAIYPRSAEDARNAFERAASRAGVRLTEAKVKPIEGTFKAAALVPYMPLVAKVA